ncbi:FlxA-like family protein [Citrobacter portucalensis]|uniref:FlxA-like family protein n=1 Tax=Citrobacter portucalensis TaxID=1639133 RepID=UPI00388EF5EF
MPIHLYIYHGGSMSISIQTNTSIKSSNSSANSESSQISQILKKIQSLTEKLGKVSSEDGMTTDQKKEMVAIIQKQIQSLSAQLQQLLRKVRISRSFLPKLTR